MIELIKVSIIIPVYNAKDYLDKCINSLINQTLKNIELIFVNDGSTDESGKIIKKYQKKDSRIVYLEKTNGGQSTARNLGLMHAKGEYIVFVDSDDYVDTSMLEILYNKAKEKKMDMVICNYSFDYNGTVEENITFEDLEKEITNNEYITLTPSPCCKLIKKSYLDKCKFKFIEGIIYEDLATIPTLVLGNPKILYINKSLYYYVQSPVSTMRNDVYKDKYENIFPAIDYLYNKLINKGYNKELEYIITYHFLYLASLNFYKYKKYEFIDKIADDMKKYAPKWYKNTLVLNKFSKKEIIYMKLFYYKKYSLIKIYRRIFNRDDKEKKYN